MTAVKDDTYPVVFVCSNCSYEQLEQVPKGYLVEDYRYLLKCGYCGCNSLFAKQVGRTFK